MNTTSTQKHETRVRNLFDAKAATWSGKYDGILQFRRDLFLRHLDQYIDPGSRVLDFGCGSGDFLVEIARRGFRVTGLDLSPQMLHQCKQRIAEADVTADLICGRIEEQRELGGKFRAVVCSSVLEYVPEPIATLTQLRLCLGDDGHLIMTVPNSESSIRQRERWLQNLLPAFKVCGFVPCIREYVRYLETSVNRFTLAELDKAARQIGFELTQHLYYDPRTGTSNETSFAEADMLFSVVRRI